MSSWDGFFSLGEIEIANEERLRTYLAVSDRLSSVRKRELEPVAGLHRAVGDAPYIDPVTDSAPWVDFDDEVTQGFLGFRIQSIEGLDDATESASVTESLGAGATIGISRASSREIRVTGVLHGETPEAAQAGLVWLRRVLWKAWRERQLAPQQAGVSDLRFFVQQPDVPAQPMNAIANPDASGLGESLVGSAGTAYAFRVPVSGVDDWAYRMIARTADDSEVQLQPTERARVAGGQQWVARARIWRDAGVLGNRVIRLYLRFRDRNGVVMPTIGADATSVPEGVLYRWTGVRFDSASEMLTPSGLVRNWMVNPAAEGNVVGLTQAPGNAARAAIIASTALGGKRSYRVTANTGTDASVVTRSAPVEPGQQWWARSRGKITTATGARHIRADLEWLDRNDKPISRSTGTAADLVPAGTNRSWTGARFNSVSREVIGDTIRYNRNPNPSHRTDTAGYSGAGGASVALERWTGLGTPNAIRLTFPAANTFSCGLNIPSRAQVGDTIYVTFWAMGVTALRLQGDGWTDLATGAVNPASGINFTINGSAPTRVSIGIKITKATQIIRVIRNGNALTGTVRFARIGLMTDTDSYFDGDTGTYEWESSPFDSSSIAHLPGNYDLYNTPWNPGFETGVGRWTADAGTAVAWVKASQRMQVALTAARSSGNVLAKQNLWPNIGGGQRVQAGMKVYNTSVTAVAAAVRVVASGGATYDGTTTTIPANGSAWLPLPTTGMPSGTAGAYPALVAKGAIASGTVLQVDSVFFGSVPDGTTPTEAMWFDGATANTNGAAFNGNAFDFSVSGVAPDGAERVRGVISRIGNAVTAAADTFLLDQVMLAQVDAVDADPTDSVDPAPVLPAYFDGEYVSTYQVITAYQIDSQPGAGATDGAMYEALVTAEAPIGATTAELAVERDAAGGVVGDVVYVDNLMLASYDGDVPDYTSVTRHSLVADAERRILEVGPIAGPTKLSQQLYGADGCNGATMEVEFTLVAQQPFHVRDNGDRVALPLPSTVNQGQLGAGSFARLEDTRGIVKNYMPQFSPSSPLIPAAWVTSVTGGSAPTVGYQAADNQPYVLRVAPVGDAPRFTTVISALNVLGAVGGSDDYALSVWLGAGKVGATLSVKAEILNGSTVVATQTKTFTAPSVSDGTILATGTRVDFQFKNAQPAGSAADGARISVTSTSATGSVYIGVPQLTLGSTLQPAIFGGLPDDGTYTYSFDGAGYSTRTPVFTPESRTIFPNRTAPPLAASSLGGYDEVGLTTYRTFAAIDATAVPRNAVAVPIVRVDFERFVSRWVRFRFYPNPLSVAPEQIPTSTYAHEWVIDQFAGNVADVSRGFMSVLIDGVSQDVWLRAWDGTVIPGDQYLVTADGSPIDWPEFADTPWVVSVDYPVFGMSSQVPTGEAWWRASLALMIKE